MMTIQGAMSSARTRHPFRWALVCALLALAGGFPATRAGYAEVAGASAVLGTPSLHHASRVAVAAAHAPRPFATAVAVVARERATRRATSPLYLAHCALLL